MIPRRGSYAEGFAPRDFRPMYPELWQGCVGAWAPCLGPTGVTLRDWAGRQNHGTLTNTTLSTVWDVSQGAYALNYDGSDDYADVASTSVNQLTGPHSACGWVNPTSAAQQMGVLEKYLNSAGDGYLLRLSSAGKVQTINGTFSTFLTGTTTITANVWSHVAYTFSGSVLTVYLNGKSDGSLSNSATFGVSTTPLRIGARGNDAAFKFSGRLDDLRIYSRELNPNEVRLLASGRGIAYTPAPRRRVFAAAATGNRRRRVICSGGA